MDNFIEFHQQIDFFYAQKLLNQPLQSQNQTKLHQEISIKLNAIKQLDEIENQIKKKRS